MVFSGTDTELEDNTVWLFTLSGILLLWHKRIPYVGSAVGETYTGPLEIKQKSTSEETMLANCGFNHNLGYWYVGFHHGDTEAEFENSSTVFHYETIDSPVFDSPNLSSCSGIIINSEDFSSLYFAWNVENGISNTDFYILDVSYDIDGVSASINQKIKLSI